MIQPSPNTSATVALTSSDTRGVPLASLRATVLWRTAVALGILIAMITGYDVIGRIIDPHVARELRTPFDDAIPFLPWTVWLYSWVYTSSLYPAFVVRNEQLFLRVVAAYLLVIAASLGTFIAMPVSSAALRPDVSLLDVHTLDGWGVRLTYFVDPPYNLFPSLHLSMATLAALSAGAARPRWGWLASPIVAAIAITICTMKQHFIVDGVAGLLLATAAWAVLVRPFRRGEDDDPELAYGWRGAVAYLVFHATVYGALIAAYLAGFAPWAR